MPRLSVNLLISLMALLMLGFTPLQTVHAQTMPMDQAQAASTIGCASPCLVTASVAVIDSQRLDQRQNVPKNQPSQPVPDYLQLAQLPALRQLVGEPSLGDRHRQPLDLVRLYANIRC